MVVIKSSLLAFSLSATALAGLVPSLNTVPGVTNDVNGVTNTATGTVQNLLPGTTSGVNGDASNLSTQVESILSDLVDKLQGITSGAVGTLKSGLPTDTVGSITSGNLHSGAGQIKQTTAELNALVPVDATLDVGGIFPIVQDLLAGIVQFLGAIVGSRNLNVGAPAGVKMIQAPLSDFGGSSNGLLSFLDNRTNGGLYPALYDQVEKLGLDNIAEKLNLGNELGVGPLLGKVTGSQ